MSHEEPTSVSERKIWENKVREAESGAPRNAPGADGPRTAHQAVYSPGEVKPCSLETEMLFLPYKKDNGRRIGCEQ